MSIHEDEAIVLGARPHSNTSLITALLSQLRRREYYEKPSVRRKRKVLAARKKRLRAQSR